MSRVALIRPSWEYPANRREPYFHNRIFVPLSLAITASMLRDRGHQVRIIDAHALRMSPSTVAGLVRECDRVFVTSSALDRWECPNVDLDPFLHTVEHLRRQTDQLHVIGVHGTLRPAEILRLTGARGLILGEPELPTVRIVDGEPLESIPGVCHWSGGEPFTTPGERPLLDIDSHPLPAFDLLPMERYAYVLMGERSVMLEGSRGCPYRCTTCLKVMYGPRYRKKSGATMIRDVRHAVERHGARNIVFIDMEFCVNRDAVEELCDFLARASYGLRWCCNTRADIVDRDLLRRLRAGGCTLINYGVESGVQEVLDGIDKRLTLDQVERAIRWTQEEGIEALAFFMVGLPGETREQMLETRRFARRLDPDYVSYHVFTPYPCTAAYERARPPSDPLFPASSGEHDEAELRRFIRGAILDFYLRPRFFLRTARRLARQRDPGRVLAQGQLLLNYLR
jgi:hypothetical protein